MYGVVSLLDALHDRRIRQLWDRLNQEVGIRWLTDRVPIAHFSYHIAERYALDALTTRLQDMGQRMPPFVVRTAGLGIFTRPEPVIFVALVRDAPLSAFHRALWEAVDEVSHGSAAHYQPDRWVPHITLAQGDVTHDTLPNVIDCLSRENYDWTIRVDHMALIVDSGSPDDVLLRVALQG